MEHEHPVHVFINKKRYEFEHHVQTGASLMEAAGIPLSDVLFLQRTARTRLSRTIPS